MGGVGAWDEGGQGLWAQPLAGKGSVEGGVWVPPAGRQGCTETCIQAEAEREPCAGDFPLPDLSNAHQPWRGARRGYVTSIPLEARARSLRSAKGCTQTTSTETHRQCKEG